ncbi:hypothetical protein BRADI_2g42220v3 [Brachypodium distachyon]|uniref:S1 motif domain-containing protein n=1 Tax=Brachypodium distachyon TaxID=15368 RepID=A0A0Q3J7G6_BRADI|nr:hypothetical protein BRADI_2g42220v3 [Brachypodium distachyon]KQK08500.1 hypothetical protein BRADI_2g42220v3 [Brachypodium distachyon]
MPPPSCRLLPPVSTPPPLSKPRLLLHDWKAHNPRQAQARPVSPARSAQLDGALSAGFVRLLNAGQEDADSGGEYYEPKSGEYAVGVVVSGTEARLDVAVGADRLATLLSKELLPLCRSELPNGGSQAVPPRLGSVGIVAASAVDGDDPNKKHGARTLVAPGTVVFAEVLGRTLSGRPLLSARRLFRRLAWHRASQIMQLDEPIEVKIYEWNTGGLLTRIEGLRAFLPKFELVDRINTFTDLKNNVGRSVRVCVIRLDKETNDFIISEKKAWMESCPSLGIAPFPPYCILNARINCQCESVEMTYLKEGTLLQGNVRKIFPYGAQVRITGTNRSIAELESAPGLFLSDKVKVFSEAEGMAKRYQEQLPVVSQNSKLDYDLPGGTIPFDNEATLYANWKWFKFLRHTKPGDKNYVT